ncbi:MAG: hypothetical protein ACYCW6_21955 [Candidatus Xenobia bacterium]
MLHDHDVIHGTLVNHTTPDGVYHKEFHPDGNRQGSIDLDLYASATPPPEAVPISKTPVWKDVVKGALVGAALPVSSLVPVLGIGIAPLALMHAGVVLDGGRTRGTLLGVLASAGALIGTWSATEGFGAVGALAVAGASALAGACIGPKVFPALRQNAAQDRSLRGQWWHDYRPPAP